MKRVLLCLASAFLGLGVSAVSAKTCEEVKAEIEARIRANGVPVFALQIVDATAAEGLKVVGSCSGGQKKIIYMRP